MSPSNPVRDTDPQPERCLAPGQHVSFRAEAASQDGFAYRTVKVWTGGVEPPNQPTTPNDHAACRSFLTLTLDPPNPTACRGRARSTRDPCVIDDPGVGCHSPALIGI